MSRAAVDGSSVRLLAVRERAETLLARTPGPDLSGPNALADDLAALAADVRSALVDTDAVDPAGTVALGECLAELTGLQDRLRTHVMAIRFTTLERIHEGLARLRALPTT